MNTPVWPRVLLIDDNEGDIELTRDAFEEARIEGTLDVSLDGREALTWLTEHCRANPGARPHVILLDLNMPDMDGREFLAELHQTAFADIPVVILTGSPSDRDILTKYDLCACDYLIKPVQATDVKALIPWILERTPITY